MPSLKVYLRPHERAALERVADEERRRLEAQAAVIIADELARRGLLPPEPSPDAEAADAT